MFLVVLEIFVHADDCNDQNAGVLSSRAQLCALSLTVLNTLPAAPVQPTNKHTDTTSSSVATCSALMHK